MGTDSPSKFLTKKSIAVFYDMVLHKKGKVHSCTGTEALYTPYGP